MPRRLGELGLLTNPSGLRIADMQRWCRRQAATGPLGRAESGWF